MPQVLQKIAGGTPSSIERTWPVVLVFIEEAGAPDIIELDKFCPPLLECANTYDSRAREEGVNPSRSRRCQWGRNPRKPLARSSVNRDPSSTRCGERKADNGRWEGAGSRVNHEPEDLPTEARPFPRGLGNRRG